MKTRIIALGVFVSFALVSVSCNTAKTTSTTTNTENTTMKAYLIDGSWEANYIMNTPKPFGELYPKFLPSIAFDSAKSIVNGNSGCNNFNGTCTIDGNKLQITESMAKTKKMCADMTGEQLFLETLKKVTSYSVTNQGKTLNLIMGDIAVMRLNRK